MDLSRVEAEAPPRAFYGISEMEAEGLPWWLLAGPPLAGLADAYTTDQVLNGAGSRELNPLARPFADRDALLYAVKVGLGAGVSLAAQRAHKGGHRKAGKAAAIIGTLGPAAFAAWNLRQMRSR